VAIAFEASDCARGPHRINDHRISVYDSAQEMRTLVDISEFCRDADKCGRKIRKPIWTGWKESIKNKKPMLSRSRAKADERVARNSENEDGKAVEGFRYYKGLPDSWGNRRRQFFWGKRTSVGTFNADAIGNTEKQSALGRPRQVCSCQMSCLRGRRQ